MKQHISALALLIRDYDEAIAFYIEKLGFDLVEDTPLGPTKRWVLVAPPGGGARLLLAKASNDEQAARIGDQTGQRVFLILHTDDFWRDHRVLTGHGITFREEPREEVYGTVVVFEDLYGNLWDLVQPKI